MSILSKENVSFFENIRSYFGLIGKGPALFFLGFQKWFSFFLNTINKLNKLTK